MFDDNLPNPTITAERNRIAQLILCKVFTDLVQDEDTYVNKNKIIPRLDDALISLGYQPSSLPPKKATPEHRNRGD